MGVMSMSFSTVKASFIEILSRSRSSIMFTSLSGLRFNFLTLTNILFRAPFVTPLSIK